MLLLPGVNVEAATIAKLGEWQGIVDAMPNYADQVAAAKAKFKQQNKKTNATFAKVKLALTEMCAGARRCVYCEDSVADEVEHIAPKDLYPQLVFKWDNYVYACGACNGPKNNRFGVLDGNDVCVEVTRKPRAPVVPPMQGDHALINPRIDNPTLFFDLDVIDTFILLPREDLDQRRLARAEFTLDVLDLNRDVLLDARSNAYGSFRARLHEYREKRDNGAPAAELAALVAGLKKMPHPTVFAEMQRSHLDIAELKALFDTVPEALLW